MGMGSIFDGQFTLGVEEEYQIVHPETRELRSYISRMVEDGKSVLAERVRPEMHQSMVEVGTRVCPDVNAVRKELTEMRRELARLARKGGLRIVAASTHPFSDWQTQEITDNQRYHVLVEDLQDIARGNLIFGMHVHVGIKDKEAAMVLANQVRYFLPHLLALTTSSPFWLGRPTGLMSTRCEIFKRFPRTGIPDEFNSYGHFQEFVDLLIKTNCVDNGKKIWWDVRVHYQYDTVEIRICDMPTRLDQTVAVVALVQALMAKLYQLYKQNQAWRTYPRSLLEENKWRAVRYGVRGKLIDFGMQKERPFAELIGELLDVVKETAQHFGTEREMETLRAIAKDGTSAERQIEVYQKSNRDPKAVVDWLIDETMRGLE
jgi:glutamate---cysteine ligase / carboxylate-amine ligase